ncbi:MAG: MBL fold metallo-hydrolase [Blastocatellia bacterium]
MNTTNPPVSPKPVTPRDAAAMILLRDPADPKLFWVRRSLKLAFMGGWNAYPGGQRDASDASVPVLNCDDPQLAAMCVCAVREAFEETGALIVRGAERVSAARLAEMRETLEQDRVALGELLAGEGLSIDAALLTPLPRWVTPAGSPRRFNTYFFAAWLPEGQETNVIPGELESGEWLRPREAISRWRMGEVLIAPPVRDPVLALAESLDGFAERLHAVPQGERDAHEYFEMSGGFHQIQLRTPTLPPATHTNCYLIGGDEFVVIDPGSPYEDEQARLDRLMDKLLAEGRRAREIIITHLHPDHIGGVNHLAERYNLPVAAHRLTAEAIADSIRVDRLIEDGELIDLGGDPGWRLRAIWSPGHARGHLAFHEERTGALVTGDCLVGMGTVVIAPPEGNMREYLASLHKLLELPKLTAMFPAHGPVLADARGKIAEYIRHRHEREAKIIAAMGSDTVTIPEIVRRVYTDVPESMHKLAELSVLAHIEKLQEEGRVRHENGHYALP